MRSASITFVGFLAYRIDAPPLSIIVVATLCLMVYSFYDDMRNDRSATRATRRASAQRRSTPPASPDASASTQTRFDSQRAVRSSRPSLPRWPTSCTPIGMPLLPCSSGSEIAGMPSSDQVVQKIGLPVIVETARRFARRRRRQDRVVAVEDIRRAL